MDSGEQVDDPAEALNDLLQLLLADGDAPVTKQELALVVLALRIEARAKRLDHQEERLAEIEARVGKLNRLLHRITRGD